MKVKKILFILLTIVSACAVICTVSFADNDETTDLISQHKERIVQVIDAWLTDHQVPENNPTGSEYKPWDVFGEGNILYDTFETSFNNEHGETLKHAMRMYMQEKEDGSLKYIILIVILGLIAIAAVTLFVILRSDSLKQTEKHREKEREFRSKIEVLEREIKSEREVHKSEKKKGSDYAADVESEISKLKTQLHEKDKTIDNQAVKIDNLTMELIRLSTKNRVSEDYTNGQAIMKKQTENMESASSNAPVRRKCNLKMVNGGVEISDGQYVIIEESEDGNILRVYPSELASDRSVRNAIKKFFDFSGYDGQKITTLSPCILRKTAYNYTIEKKGKIKIS